GNDTRATATSLGALPGNGSVSRGTSVSNVSQFVAATATDFLSIDGTSDTDFYSVTMAVGTRLAVTVTPVGPTYRSGAQGGPAPTPFNATSQSDLILQLVNDTGAVVATSNAGGLGVAETIPSFDTPLGGDYFVRVTGATDAAQMYRLDVSST